MLQVLNGLGIEYNPITMEVTTKLSSYSIDEVTSLLVTVQKNLEEQTQSSDSFTANVVARPDNNNSCARGNF